MLAKAFCLSGLHTVAKLFVSMEQVIGEKEGIFMKNKIKYTEEPMGDLKIIPEAIMGYLNISQEVTDKLFSDAANLFS